MDESPFAATKTWTRSERLTHKELVARAVKWLHGRANCPIAIPEGRSDVGGEIPDAIGFHRCGCDTVVIECKASRADFLQDANKPHRKQPESGMGTFRYFLCAPGIIDQTEIPPGWGLLWAKPSTIAMVRDSVAFDVQPSALMSERALLYSLIHVHNQNINRLMEFTNSLVRKKALIAVSDGDFTMDDPRFYPPTDEA